MRPSLGEGTQIVQSTPRMTLMAASAMGARSRGFQ